MTDVGALANFLGNSALFKFKQKITGSIGNDDIKALQIKVTLKYLSNFWRTLKMPLINCEINILLTWSEEYITVTGNYGDQKPKIRNN